MIFEEKKGSLKAGFTLLELLVVVAVICLLVGLLFPCVGLAKKSLARAQTRIQLNQYATALCMYYEENGEFPAFLSQSSEEPVNLADWSDAFMNAIGEEYHKFSKDEVSNEGYVVDGFGNRDIFIMVDAKRKGSLHGADLPSGGLRQEVVVYTKGLEPVRSWD